MELTLLVLLSLLVVSVVLWRHLRSERRWRRAALTGADTTGGLDPSSKTAGDAALTAFSPHSDSASPGCVD